MEFPKITIVTPNKNGGRFLEACILSVLDQNYPNLEYIIVDGDSSDSSLEIIEKYKRRIAFSLSEIDSGQAEAVNKGFQRSTGGIMCWLNSDDMLHPGSLHLIGRIFSELPEVDWIMGRPTFFGSDGKMIRNFFINQELTPRPPIMTKSMYRAWTRWSKHRFYNGDYLAIQQESTCWRRSLWEAAGGKIDPAAAPAIDFELWLRFFDHARLYTVERELGGFRYHSENQISIMQREKYMRACREAAEKKLSTLTAGQLQDTRDRWRKSREWKAFFYLDIPFFRNKYSELLELPPLITWNEKQQELRMERF